MPHTGQRSLNDKLQSTFVYLLAFVVHLINGGQIADKLNRGVF